MIATEEKLVTVEEYFSIEKKSESRHEFYYGNLLTMPGESKLANIIALNLSDAIRKILRKNGYETYLHDVRLKVNDKLYRYPDLMVAPKSDQNSNYYVHKPILVAEVLSDSTQEVDAFVKTKEYCSISSMHYYLMISQKEMLVELYQRKEAKDGRSVWEFSFYENLEDSIELPNLGISLTLREIYEDIDL